MGGERGSLKFMGDFFQAGVGKAEQKTHTNPAPT